MKLRVSDRICSPREDVDYGRIVAELERSVGEAHGINGLDESKQDLMDGTDSAHVTASNTPAFEASPVEDDIDLECDGVCTGAKDAEERCSFDGGARSEVSNPSCRSAEAAQLQIPFTISTNEEASMWGEQTIDAVFGPHLPAAQAPSPQPNLAFATNVSNKQVIFPPLLSSSINHGSLSLGASTSLSTTSLILQRQLSARSCMIYQHTLIQSSQSMILQNQLNWRAQIAAPVHLPLSEPSNSGQMNKIHLVKTFCEVWG